MNAIPNPRMAIRLPALSLAVAALMAVAAEPAAAAEPATNSAAEAPATASAAVATAAQWQRQKLSFDYSGFTTKYSCNGLEDKVREILLTFGARKDLKVRATGCAEGSDRPSRMAWVTAEFSSLAPLTKASAAAAKPADTVKVDWVKVRLAPNRPSYMGGGECELVEEIRDLLQKGFVLRNAVYHTACTPHHISIADYSVTAEVMKPAAK